MTSSGVAPKKIAVLGGGVGAITTAFALTEEPNWQDRYDITVYQLGWRLGGKGASGRDLGKGARIQEHGLHIWAGFYDNSFRLMRQCYEQLNRPASVPIRSVEQAFHAVNQIYLSDFVDDHPHIWRVDFPANSDKPGSGGVLLTPLDYLMELLEGLKEIIERFPIGGVSSLEALLAAMPTELRPHARGLNQSHGLSHLHVACALARRVTRTDTDGPLHRLIHWLLHEFLESLGERSKLEKLNPPEAAVKAALEIGGACAKGMIQDKVLEHGFDSLDDMEWTDWVIKHGASKKALESSVGRCAYDYVFAWRGGSTLYEDRSMAAGAGLRAILRLLFTYKGSLFFKLNAGMGDIVFAPYYELLRQRGVKFRFFHKVDNLGLSADGRQITTIEIERQVNLKNKTQDAEYQPLCDVGGLPCWPSTPLFDQIEDGSKIESDGINLESMWSGWPGVGKCTLKRGIDFDLVVLGISLGGLPKITSELHERLPRWKDMLDNVETVATQAMQFWFNESLQDLGWPASTGVLTAYYEPIDTWSDMSFLLPRENWPEPGPQQISYVCGSFAPTEEAPPFGPNDYPARQLVAMQAAALPWIHQRLPQLLPNTEGANGKFDFGKLYAPGADSDEERLNAQYARINLDPPSELYVQSVPGSTKYRLSADSSGVDNLFLAGDWLLTGVNAGCVEAATMGGLQAARAITGSKIPIVGEKDLAESPLAAQNAGWPWSAAFLQGQVSSAVVTLMLPTKEIAKLLMPGMVLLPQRMTAAGTHPVALIFSDQHKVRLNLTPFGGASYKECAIAIPFVGVKDRHGKPMGPFMFMPALYLDSLLPTVAGRAFYGYRKHLARVHGKPGRQSVRDLLSGEPVISASLIHDGPDGLAYEFENLASLRDMMNQPFVSSDPIRGWMYSFIDYQFEFARITPLHGAVTVAPGVLGNSQLQAPRVQSVRTEPLGAFEFRGGWTLTNPLESHILERTYIGQR